MQEWSGYALEDLMLFSAGVYQALISHFNVSVWPVQMVALLLSVLLVARIVRHGDSAMVRMGLALISWGPCWFLVHHYSQINWAAVYLAWIYALQGLALLFAGTGQTRPYRPAKYLGWGLVGYALLVKPAWQWQLSGVQSLTLPGLLPGATAILLFGLLLLLRARLRLWLLPLLLAIINYLTLWLLEISWRWEAPVIAALLLLTMLLSTFAALHTKKAP